MVSFFRKQARKGIALLALASLLITPFLANASFVQASGEVELLRSPWRLSANSGASERYQSISSNALVGKDTVRITYDLHGLCALTGDASAFVFDQGGWKYTPIADYGQNCKNGSQTIDIPLSKFTGLDTNKAVSSIRSRFWYDKPFTVDITSVKVLTKGTSSTNPTPTTSPAPVTVEKELLSSAWKLTGNNGASEKYQSIPSNALQGMNALRITYDLHGLRAYGGDASAIIIDQGDWRFISLSDYGQNGKDGVQTVDIPLSKFAGLDLSKPVGTLHTRFWADKQFTVDITSIKAIGTSTSTTSPSPTPTPDPTTNPTPVSGKSWDIQSVSSMKESKDRVCGPRDRAFIEHWVDKAKELGANYVAVETPYQSPSCGNTVDQTRVWIEVIRSRGMKVWHRHMHLAFEGIYSTPKNPSADYNGMMAAYIKNNPWMFEEGDIFTPQPEPQNGGIQGITYCSEGVCIFNSKEQFNQFLRDGIDKANEAFNQIGLGGKMKVGYYGFDGFVAWGSQNPDWNGILEDATVAKMGNIAIDHYPELIGDTMDNALSELKARYPGVPIFISEWGSTGSTNHEQQVINTMGAAKKHGVIGFNYWHMGMGGQEALINEDFSNRSQYDEVQSYFKGTR